MTDRGIIVIGAGASGLMAAGRAAELGAQVILLEKTDSPGKKILISGKTRCNLTNQKELDDFIMMYGSNGRFLYRAFNHFFRDDLLTLLRGYGVETKTERGGRIFPVSDDARDVVTAFERYITDHGVQMKTNIRVTGIMVDKGHVIGVRTEHEEYPAAAVVLATGGASFPGTGSTGDGYRLAAALGHTITKLRPALVPLVVEERELAGSMQGVSLRNVRLTAFQCPADKIDIDLAPTSDSGRGITGKRPRFPVIESRLGEMMMTHFGIGGPITLHMSLAIVDALEHGPVSVAIDLKPGLDIPQLRQRLQRDFDSFGKRNYRHLLKELLPNKLIEPFIQMSGISPETPGHQISAEGRERLLNLLKSLRFNIKGPLPLTAAMVTAGGVSLKEIDPGTMASRLVAGLYFCGEIMDIDADTGGYNLQAAFSTGSLAGEQAAQFATGTT
ncbi:MAG: NAD(P)/FAD-dependent oxidoreductase [Dehalococcoidales bacterium]|nr:NAD(P)/FAD-dependent oxidoreductase [Dehalococcoidales bacterium]